ncbi:helix-turn-helix domain-containing protein [Brucella pseudintermedia]|uniref:Helix-turn-helix domain-containing protein n=1 Tax=Brucella pseudintermedia TaxID=370111 RepID=A0ABY5UJM5_9HYPH|nr:helix-turn-helix domain-containing protein [Brucella pseudintermedia]UWL61965.1 helix-turn-helix domain-containing protein [Brucella pseudintermedia]
MTTNVRVKQAAAYLGLSKSTMDKLRHFGGGPRYFKLGRSVIYDVADLDAWRNDRAATSTWQAANQNNAAARAAA